MRDFSAAAKETLLGYVEEVTASGIWEKIGDAIGDCGLTVQGWLEQLGILTCTQDVEQYYKKILDKNNTTKEEIEEIFTNVQKVDADYVEKILELMYVGNLLIKYITDMTDSIDPDGGKIDVGKLTELLESDKEELEKAQLVVVKTLVEDDELEDATEYVEAVVSYKLTYDEFEALSEEEQLNYLGRVADWLLALYPNIELEAGKYEISVPIGADMAATYNVTVTASGETGNNNTVKITMEEQQMVIKSAYKLDYKNLSASVDSDGVSAGTDIKNGEFVLKGTSDGNLLVNGQISNGKSKAKVETGTNGVTSSMKFEVSTVLDDKTSVSSFIKVDKSNNTDMPGWELIPIDVEEEYSEPIEYKIDGEKIEEGAIVAVVAIGLYEIVKWGVAIATAPETMGASIGVAVATP
ncbi:hypothetical protein [Roseburia sp. 831b]|uniref:hypothetical protein n=1 Tax=Roseburia sp. 831b TaxID=1261635 RepID=UPI000950C95B|nr:hypothetical protein [Roseburia sp. 831b]WVK73196.1 hypothetical protein BIV16_01365 [Roseburia sp. 831b]